MGIGTDIKYRIMAAIETLERAFRRPSVWYNRVQNYQEQLARSMPRYRESGVGYAEKNFPQIKEENACKVMAFYLPQYHRFDVNDHAWGLGFTDWENVARAMPVFRGHYQPRLVGEFGYYDLNNAEVHARQVEAAKEAGIHALCYHHYWFDPQVVMDMPVERHMKEFDQPFMLCWANENWSKRWDGSEAEVILPQDYNPGCAERAGRYFSRYFQSAKYVKIAGRPAFIIYRTDKIPGLDAFIEQFSRTVEEIVGVRPYLISALTFDSKVADGATFDRSVYFPPHKVTGVSPIYRWNGKVKEVKMLREYGGTICRFEDLVQQQALAYQKTRSAAFPTVCPGWDNTARKPADAYIFYGDTPALFERWIKHATTHLATHFQADERLLFVNAWNEWAEGAHLEPDRVRGFAYLNVLSKYCGK